MVSSQKHPPSDERRLAARRKVSEFRRRQREKGLRLLQIWVPETRTPEFAEEARRQSRAVATAEDRAEQDFVDSVSEIWDK